MIYYGPIKLRFTCSLNHIMLFYIENEEITKSNLATFNYLWSIAEKPSQLDVNKRLLR
jgi:hypothetical protein